MNEKYATKGSTQIRAIEELSELIQAIAKGERFGWHAYHPDHSINNIEQALSEIEDVRRMCDELEADLKGPRMTLKPACGCSPAGPCPYAAVLWKHKYWQRRLTLHLTYALQRAAGLAKGDLRFHPVRRPKHLHVYQPGEPRYENGHKR